MFGARQMKKIYNTPSGVKYASCFIGSMVETDHFHRGRLLACYQDYFVVKSKGGYYQPEFIKIDTDKYQPCIYACMREGFKVQITRQVLGEIEILESNINGIREEIKPKSNILDLVISLDQKGIWLSQVESIKILGDFKGVEDK
jgi:hypothetical protein